MPLAITGAEQLRQVGVELRAAPVRMRARLRRNIVVASAPITSEAKAGWSGSYGSFGADLAAATKLRVRSAGRLAGVSVLVQGSSLPEGKQGLPPQVEGLQRWRHPLFGNRDYFYGQDPHPELGPAVERHLPGVQVAVIEAVEETAVALARGAA